MRYILSLLLAILLFSPAFATGQSPDKGQKEAAPFSLANDPALQQKLEQLCKQLRLQQQVTSNHLALAVLDLSDPKTPRLAELNGNRMYYAASLPKIAILLGALVEIQAGNLEDSPELYKHMTAMIRNSSNSSANYVLSLVGGERILEIIQDPALALYDPQKNGGLWIGKPYGKGGAYSRDPLHNLSHGATAVQVARFYYLLETGQLLGPEYSAKMKEILSKPGIAHKFVAGLQQIQGIEIYRKSGTWKSFHSDSALVEYKQYRYVIVGLADSKKGGKWLEKLALPLHQMITGEK